MSRRGHAIASRCAGAVSIGYHFGYLWREGADRLIFRLLVTSVWRNAKGVSCSPGGSCRMDCREKKTIIETLWAPARFTACRGFHLSKNRERGTEGRRDGGRNAGNEGSRD